MTKQALVIGAGPGGLAAAMLLARSGCRVRVLERQPHIGGRTSSIQSQGFRFDLGPTFFLYPRVLQEIFASCGYDLFREVPMIRLDPQYRLLFGSENSAQARIDATPNVERMVEQIARFSPKDAAAFPRFLAENREKLARFRPALESPFESWRDLINLDMLKMLPLLRPWNCLDDELKRYFSDPRIRLAFSFQSKYLGMSPFSCPALFSILSFLEYEHGVFHPIGGCASVTAAMARIATSMGVEILLDQPATEILFHGKRATGVRTPTAEFHADAVVVNGDFARVMPKLVPDSLRSKWKNASIAKKKYSCSTFMMYLGVEGIQQELPHHTIYMSDHYRQNLSEIESLHVLSQDPSFYVQNACVTDPSLAPKGMSTLYLLAPVTHQHDNVDWNKESSSFRARLLKQVEKAGVKDLEKRIRFEKIITPLTWETDYEIHRGATFSMAHGLAQMLNFRPHNRFEDLQSVYLVGGGTHPGSGLPVIFESARIATKLLLKDLGVSATAACSAPHVETAKPSMAEAA